MPAATRSARASRSRRSPITSRRTPTPSRQSGLTAGWCRSSSIPGGSRWRPAASGSVLVYLRGRSSSRRGASSRRDQDRHLRARARERGGAEHETGRRQVPRDQLGAGETTPPRPSTDRASRRGCRIVQTTESGSVFNRPCHGGQFGAEGRVLRGPPPRPLDRVALQHDARSGAWIVGGTGRTSTEMGSSGRTTSSSRWTSRH